MNMKTSDFIKMALTFAVCAISLPSCYFRITEKAREEIKKDNNRVEGDIKTDTLSFFPDDFSGILNNGSMDILFIQREGKPKVTVTTSSNLLDSVVVFVNDSKELEIKYTCPTVNVRTNAATVYAPSIGSLTNNGSGDIVIEGDFLFDKGFTGEEMVILSRGSGDIDISSMELSTRLAVTGSGSGDISITKLKADSMQVEMYGSGDFDGSRIEVNALDLKSSGSGDISVEGKGEKISAVSRGSGDIDAGGFKASSSERIIQSGSGSLTCTIGGVTKRWEDGEVETH